MRHLPRSLSIIVFLVVVAAIGAVAFFFWPHGLPAVEASASQPHGADLIARGKYLTTAADCEACHTAPGGQPFAGGLAFKLPFGTIYAPNITPDIDTGIGSWNDAEFVRAVRSGVGKHGEDLYPAFPYTSYALLSTDDILAIKAYLAKLKPVSNRSRVSDLSFPFNQRWAVRGWKFLFVPWGQFKADHSKSAEWNNGAYLVEALAHCGECHTPRGLLFQRKQGEALSGGEVDGWKAWNITSDKTSGIGRWSDDAIASYISTGHTVGHGPAAGAMRQAIDLSLGKLPRSDIDAIVSYLRTVPARPSSYDGAVVSSVVPAAQASQSWTPSEQGSGGLGEKIFEGACASCHGWDGSGQNNPRAALLGSHSVNDPSGSNLVRVVLQGSSDPERTAATAMPAFAKAYSDIEIAALANYMIAHFGNQKGQVTPKDVAQAR